MNWKMEQRENRVGANYNENEIFNYPIPLSPVESTHISIHLRHRSHENKQGFIGDIQSAPPADS